MSVYFWSWSHWLSLTFTLSNGQLMDWWHVHCPSYAHVVIDGHCPTEVTDWLKLGDWFKLVDFDCLWSIIPWLQEGFQVTFGHGLQLGQDQGRPLAVNAKVHSLIKSQRRKPKWTQRTTMMTMMVMDWIMWWPKWRDLLLEKSMSQLPGRASSDLLLGKLVVIALRLLQKRGPNGMQRTLRRLRVMILALMNSLWGRSHLLPVQLQRPSLASLASLASLVVLHPQVLYREMGSRAAAGAGSVDANRVGLNLQGMLRRMLRRMRRTSEVILEEHEGHLTEPFSIQQSE